MFFPSGQESNSPSCTEMIKQWWKTVPFFNRAIFYGCSGIYLLSWFFPEIDAYGVLQMSFQFYFQINTPSLTIEKFQLWRIITACFVHIQLLQLFFCLISLLPSSAVAERKQGSTLFFMNIMAEAFLIQALFAVISFILSLLISIEGYAFYSAGLWSIVMVYISLRSYANPEQETNFLCFPIQIKQKYYPWLILLLFSIFSMFQIVDLFCGILVGYIEYKYFNGRLIKPADQKLQFYEDKYFSSVKNNENYIDVHQAGNEQTNSSVFSQQGAARRQEQQQQEREAQPAFGGAGTQIGGHRPTEIQNKIDEFHRERIEAQQRRLQVLQSQSVQQQQSNQQQSQKEEKKSDSELKPFSGKGISLGEESQKQAKRNDQGYINLNEEFKDQSGDLI